ncbi:hypothetical protein [Hymenobacter terrenus]|uniref:hypothetical protein n=1 Tax=Hymenobacter terrenus TaxID=1629124 RepID=UPI0006191F72|nr:hypothetical protein [Hymenobacter terrenus]
MSLSPAFPPQPVASAAHSPRLLLDELVRAALEGEDPPLVSSGIGEGKGAKPSTGNHLFATAHEARRAAVAEAARRNAAGADARAQNGTMVRHSVAHHAPKGPTDQGHYHVVNEKRKQVSGHFFYGGQPVRGLKKDKPGPPGRLKTAHGNEKFQNQDAREPGFAQGNYADILNDNQDRTEWHGARSNKAEGRQRRRMRKGYELDFESNLWSVIHPHIDVFAQYALQRLLSSDSLGERIDAQAMLTAVRSKSPTLRINGIYKEDEREPALWAQKRGQGWWTLIGKNPQVQSAVLVWTDSPVPTGDFQYLIIFRDRVRSNPALLDPALRRAWRTVSLVRMAKFDNPSLTPAQAWLAISGNTVLPFPPTDRRNSWVILRPLVQP